MMIERYSNIMSGLFLRKSEVKLNTGSVLPMLRRLTASLTMSGVTFSTSSIDLLSIILSTFF